jgi:small subunit ribosomal protein S21
MEITVEGSLDQALRVLKRKLAKEGVLKEWRKRAFYEKPSRKQNHEGFSGACAGRRRPWAQ